MPMDQSSASPAPQPSESFAPTPGLSSDVSKSSRTTFVAFFGIVALLAVGLGGVLLGKYLYTPKTLPVSSVVTPTQAPIATLTPDPTAEWKVYRNPVYNFEFKYPSDWTLVIDLKAEENGSKVSTFQSPDGEFLDVTVFNLPIDFDAEKSVVPEAQEIIIFGRIGIKANNKKIVLPFSPSHSVTIVYNACHGPECGFGLKIPGLLDQILSTFRFLE